MDKLPVCVVKNGVVLPMDSLQYVEAPFNFVIAGRGKMGLDGSEVREFSVEEGDRVVYFQRKRVRISKGKVVAHFVYRICIGRIRKDGVDERYWISPTGDYIEPNLEPMKERQ
jgi:hypothetical protein